MKRPGGDLDIYIIMKVRVVGIAEKGFVGNQDHKDRNHSHKEGDNKGEKDYFAAGAALQVAGIVLQLSF